MCSEVEGVGEVEDVGESESILSTKMFRSWKWVTFHHNPQASRGCGAGKLLQHQTVPAVVNGRKERVVSVGVLLIGGSLQSRQVHVWPD